MVNGFAWQVVQGRMRSDRSLPHLSFTFRSSDSLGLDTPSSAAIDHIRFSSSILWRGDNRRRWARFKASTSAWPRKVSSKTRRFIFMAASPVYYAANTPL